MESKTVNFFNKLSFILLSGSIFLSLFFFIPYLPVTLDASKGFLLSVGATLALFFWLIARLGEGKFVFPKDRLLLIGGSIPLVFLVSSLFSSSKYISLFGSGFEIGTFGSMLVFFIILFLSSIYFQKERKIWNFFVLLFIGGVILSVFEILNIFLNFSTIAPGLFKGVNTGNLVGNWNNFALLFGLLILISTFTLDFLKSSKLFKFIQVFLIISGILFLAIINVSLVWLLVGLFASIMFVYSISIQHAYKPNNQEITQNKKKFPFISLLLVLISFIFLFGGQNISGFIAKYVSVSNIDVRPSVTSTFNVAWKAIKHNPILGTGPNTFSMDWALWQPKDIAQTVFWNVDFNNGYSTLLTFLTTTGVLGFIAFLLFLVCFFIKVIKSLKLALQNPYSNYFVMITLITSVYSWISFVLYTPNIVIITMAFVSTGILVGILTMNQTIPTKTLSFLEDPRHSFFSILGIMVLMIVSLSLTYVYAEKFTSVVYFSRSANTTDTIESLSKAERMVTNALILDKNDIYYRTLSQIYIAEIQALLNDKKISEDVIKSNVQQLINLAEGGALSAVKQNPKQYLNHLNQADVYKSLVSLGIDKSYESAISAYDKARALAPNNPSILLARASLEITHKDNDKARTFIGQALDMKINYTDALFLLAQIDTNEGKIQDAIKQAEKASFVSPNDSTVFFRLGLLKYNNGDYSGAVSAFEKAVILNPNYLNARYFLGQAYQKTGRSADALVQFKLLSQVLPDNQDVKDAINSISSNQKIEDVADTKTINNTKTTLPDKKQ